VDASESGGTLVWEPDRKTGQYPEKVNQDYQFYATVEFLKEYLLK
jgi:hypothetical protein